MLYEFLSFLNYNLRIKLRVLRKVVIKSVIHIWKNKFPFIIIIYKRFFIYLKWHYETVCFMFIANFVVRKVADNSEFFILTTSIDECDHNDDNGLFLFICLCCYTKCIWMSSIKYSWFNVFYAVFKVNHYNGYLFICYMGNRNNSVNANIYLYMYG